MAKRTCPNGHVVKDNKALKCPQCGEDLPPVTKRKLWPYIVGVIVLFLLCGIVGMLMGGDDDGGSATAKATRTPRPTATPRPTKTPKPTNTPKPISDLTYEDLQAKRDETTDAQWKAYWEPLKGTRVEWSGWITEVKENGKVWVDMDEPGTVLSSQDVYITVPKEDVLGYNLEQEITFQGDIQSITEFLGHVSVTLNDTVVLE